jgi:hypothetical protein
VAVLVPVAAAVVGADYLYTRNVLPGLVPVLVLAGAGFAALPGRCVGAAVLALLGLVTVIGVDRNEAYQRADWRALSGALGEAAGPRLLVVSPGKAEVPLGAYRDGAGIAPAAGARVREIDVAAVAVNGSGGGAASPPRPAAPPTAPPGFALAASELRPTYTLYRYRATRPVAVAAAPVAAARLNSSFSLLLLRP